MSDPIESFPASVVSVAEPIDESSTQESQQLFDAPRQVTVCSTSSSDLKEVIDSKLSTFIKNFVPVAQVELDISFSKLARFDDNDAAVPTAPLAATIVVSTPLQETPASPLAANAGDKRTESEISTVHGSNLPPRKRHRDSRSATPPEEIQSPVRIPATPHPTAYKVFLQHVKTNLAAALPFSEQSKRAATLWSGMTSEDRQPFVLEAERQLAEYADKVLETPGLKYTPSTATFYRVIDEMDLNLHPWVLQLRNSYRESFVDSLVHAAGVSDQPRVLHLKENIEDSPGDVRYITIVYKPLHVGFDVQRHKIVVAVKMAAAIKRTMPGDRNRDRKEHLATARTRFEKDALVVNLALKDIDTDGVQRLFRGKKRQVQVATSPARDELLRNAFMRYGWRHIYKQLRAAVGTIGVKNHPARMLELLATGNPMVKKFADQSSEDFAVVYYHN